MTQWIALSRSDHAEAHYRPRDAFHVTAGQAVAPVLLAELGRLLPHYVLGFIAQGDGYQPVALLSLDGQRNLYLNADGRWLAGYVPASLRGHPFTLAQTEQGQKQKVLAIAADHLVDEGQPLFDEAGELSEPVARTLQFLNQCDRNRQPTWQAAQALGDAGVIEPWPLQLSRGEGQEPLKVQGLYRVSEQALNGLEAEAFATLRGGPLALAHAQLFSTHQLNQLTERAKLHAQQSEVPENLDSLLDGMEDDDLTFDFDT
ncbi:SapC family protein [Halomonas sp. H10-9-1]|uniref:SapC family protein n=1 Tax=Halomonas sp. H10-9-1 TaxID=2950871 RepID=UPI0032DFBFB2